MHSGPSSNALEQRLLWAGTLCGWSYDAEEAKLPCVSGLPLPLLQVAESPESWEAILQGTAALVTGLAALVVAGQCEEEVVGNLFLSGTLVKLLERCPSVEARQLVMAMAAALPGMDASAEVRGRCAAGCWVCRPHQAKDAWAWRSQVLAAGFAPKTSAQTGALWPMFANAGV